MDRARQWWRGLKVIEKAAVTFLAVIALAFVASIATASSGPDQPDDETVAARVACHAQVRAKLKAPSTADIDDTDGSGGPQGPWTFTGTVDAENSFGAKIRGGWRCEIAKTDDGWDVREITVR